MSQSRRWAALALTLAFLVPGGTANAKEVYPNEGGQWIYGASWPQAYSNYYHATRCHGSTVASDSKTSRSVDIRPGKWSDEHIWWYSGAARYYYRVC